MKQPIKHKIIIDCNPGIDDSLALILSLYEPIFDIKLITTIFGSSSVESCTNNTLYILEKLNFDIPVCKGYDKPMIRERKYATHTHGEQGMGNYCTSTPTMLKPIEGNVEDKIYEIIKQYPNEIILMLWGPHTNIGKLFIKYPDSIKLIKGIIFEGGSPYGYKNTKPHISFNISSDPEASNIILSSEVKKLMVPSELGRLQAYISNKNLLKYKDYGEIGKFVYDLCDNNWEPGFDDKRIATNTILTAIALTNHSYFKPVKGYTTVDVEDAPGKTDINFKSKTPNTTVLMNANGKKINNLINKKLKELKDKVVKK